MDPTTGYTLRRNIASIIIFVFDKFYISLGKKMGFEVNQIFPEQGNMGLVLPEYLTKWTTEKVRKEGVNVITETMVRDVCMEDGKVKVTTKNDEQVSY